MQRFNVTEANDSFDDLLEMSALEVVAIENDGSDVGILLSIDEYNRRLAQHPREDLIDTNHDESLKRYGKVYDTLAK